MVIERWLNGDLIVIDGDWMVIEWCDWMVI